MIKSNKYNSITRITILNLSIHILKQKRKMSYHYHSIIKISLKDCLILWVGCSNFIILLFHSCQIVHKMQKVPAFQALEFPCFWKVPLQKLNICATVLGINHETVNRVHAKDQKMFHSFPTILGHAAPFNSQHVTFPKIFHS